MSFDPILRPPTFVELIERGVLQIGDGYRAKNDELGGTGPIFLRAGHVRDTHIDFDGVDRFRTNDKSKFKDKLSCAGDVVVTTKGNSTGRVAFVTHDMPEFVYSPHLSYWRSLDESCLCQGFLRAWSRGVEFSTQLGAMSRSTDMAPYLSLSDQKRLRITLLAIEEQRTVAALIDALDDRITLLRETNATLEAIAQALFKSWFVDFDPVRAKQEGRTPDGMDDATAALFPDSFEESEFGLVPTGWRVGALGDIARTARQQLKVSELHGGLRYVGLEHIPRKSLTLTDWGNAEGLESAKAAFSEGDILFGKLRPYFHKVVVAPFAGVCSTDILVCQPVVEEHFGVVAMHLFSDSLIAYADRLSNGAKMPRVNWKDLAAYPICVPSITVAASFSETLSPLFARLKKNTLQAQTLATLRDTLLPRLISGQLRLPEAEAEAAVAAANV